ncbi:hypothetical protein Trydic_g12787 [Trypoxylus dichotomus]
MPESTYIPLEGSGSRGYCWTSLTSLEKILILLSGTLAIFVLALTIALVSCNKGGDTPSNSTTTSIPPTSTSTTLPPTTNNVPTTEVTSPAPVTNSTSSPNITEKPSSEPAVKLVTLPIIPPTITTTLNDEEHNSTETAVKSETES